MQTGHALPDIFHISSVMGPPEKGLTYGWSLVEAKKWRVMGKPHTVVFSAPGFFCLL
jgi:hypothetical protein